MRKASTRDNVYQTLSEKYRIKASSIRSAASGAGLTSRRFLSITSFRRRRKKHLLKFAYGSHVSINHSRFPISSGLQFIFSGTHRQSSFTRKFVNCFVRRHRDVLCKRRGKHPSPKRISRVVLSNTVKFIERFDSKMRREIINTKYIVVCDESVIGDSVAVSVVIGGRRKSGGKNNNFPEIHHARLGACIRFSMPDRSTPFRVFIFKVKDLKRRPTLFTVLGPRGKE